MNTSAVSLRRLFFFCIIFFLLLNAFGQVNILSFSKKSYNNDSYPQCSFFDNGISGFEAEYNFPGAAVTEKSVNDVLYHYLIINGFSQMQEVGRPSLPAHNDIVALPVNANPKIIIMDYEIEEYSGYNIHPALKPAIDTKGAPDPEFEIDNQIYSTDAYFPKKPVEIVEIQKLRGIPIAIVQIRPVQFNPVQKKIKVFSKIRYRIEFEGAAKSFDQSLFNNSDNYNNLLKNIIINDKVIPIQHAVKSYDSQAKNYIIITHSNYLSAADTLATWKKQMGLTVDIVSKSSWTAAQVKDSIRVRYMTWSPKPDYFVIIGDHDKVPGEIYTDPYYGDNFATDLYYACMDGTGDYFPDMAHGRISVSSAAEAMSVILKIVNYERNPVSAASFYSNGLNCVQFQDDDYDGYEDRRFTKTSEDVRSYLISKGYNIARVYYTESSVNPTNYNNATYSTGQPIPSELLRANGFAWDGDAADITSAINAGKFYVLHRDHGYSGGTGWASPEYLTSDIDYLSNGNNLPVVFSINCHTGEFMLPECFAEKFLRKSGGGAVGVFAASYLSLSGYNDGLTTGFFDAIWSSPGLVPVFGTGGVPSPTLTPHSDIRTMGDVLNQGLIRMMEIWAGETTYFRYTHELFHYFGDPAMRIPTASPQTILASHTDTIPCGATSLSITSSNCLNGFATLYFNGTVIGNVNLTGGAGTMTFSEPVSNIVSSAKLTITCPAFRPYIVNIPISDSCSIAPIAGFIVANQNVCFGSQVTIQNTSYFTPTSWDWTITPATYTFMNGTNQSSEIPQVLFNSMGNYSISLIVTNSYGSDTLFKTNYISVIPLASDFTADLTTCNVGETVTFSDMSSCTPSSWTWIFQPAAISFVNSTSQYSQSPAVQFNAPGLYSVTLITANPYGADTVVKSNFMDVLNEFTMCTDISSTATSGLLYDSGGPTGSYSDYENCSFLISIPCAQSITLSFSSFQLESGWDYLSIYDGTNQSGTLLLDATGSSIPGPVTATSGNMFIMFTSDGSVTYPGFAASWSSIVPPGSPITADFSISDTNPPLGADVQFTDLSTNMPVSWDWDFGDGVFATAQNPVHAYLTPGFYTVSLIANNCYSADTVIKTLLIQEAPNFSINPYSYDVSINSCNDSVSLPLTIYNTGIGTLTYEILGSSSGTLEVLALTYGVDLTTEYPNTLNAINQFFTNYNLTEINTTSATALATALTGKDVLLIAEQESGSASVFTGFATTLQNFVSNGGTVVFCGASNSSCIFNTGLFNGSYGTSSSYATLTINDITHPLMAQVVTPLTAQDLTYCYSITNPDADIVASYSGYAAVAYREIGAGKAIYVGYDFYSYHVNASHIIANAIQLGNAEEIPEWISVSSYTGTVSPSDSTALTVTFNSSTLSAGQYTSNLIIMFNDPLTPEIAIPCTLTVTGNPEIAFPGAGSCFHFDTVMVWTTSTDSIAILNTGCTNLNITNITHSSGVFVIAPATMNIIPHDSVWLHISFSPTSIQTYSDMLNIFSNAGDTTICITGTGEGAPTISVSPANFNVTINGCNDSITLPLTITNSGLGTLDYLIEGDPSDILEVLALTYGVDIYTEYPNTLLAINQYFTDYNLTEINTTSSSVLATALSGKDVLLISDQEYGSSSVFAGFATVLQDFVTNGGMVIFCGTTNSACITSTGLLTGSYSTYLYTGNLTIVDNSHPILEQVVPPLTAQYYVYCYNFTSPGMHDLVTYSGYDVVTYRDLGQGKVIYIGYDYYYYHNNSARIIGNAVKYGGAGSLPEWISFSGYSGSAPVSGSSTVQVTFNSTGLSSGTYLTSIVIHSNDPLNQEIEIPCLLTVNGQPGISFEPDTSCIDMGYIQETGTSVLNLAVINSGCDILNIYNIMHYQPEFIISPSSMNINPGDTGWVTITFHPFTIGSFFDSVKFFNNAGTQTICVSGSSYGAPDISVTPASLLVTISECDGSAAQSLTISNSGNGSLSYNISGAGISFYDSTSTQTYSTVAGANTYHYFNGIPASPDSLYIIVTINGDFDLTSEYCDVYADGNYIGRIEGWENYTDITQTFGFTGSQASSWISDGNLTILLDNSPEVNTGYGTNLHRVRVTTTGTAWLTATPDTGTVQTGGSQIINVTFNAAGLSSAIYQSQLVVHSNEPGSPQLTIPVIMIVNGQPEIEFGFSAPCFDVGTIMEWTTTSANLTISNTGCKTLNISNIIHSLSQFVITPSTLGIPPGVTDTVVITFTPTAQSTFTDSLHIFNNAHDTVICITGTGTGAPFISVTPPSFNVTITECEGSVTEILTIGNTGAGMLNYNITGSGSGSFDSTSTQYWTTTGASTYHYFNGIPSSPDSLYIIIT
ncbi:MAG: DUF1573 domain-containing protein, partial [Bacteroidia bacterium]|nr:DUF1573 domain-containing protein [Bacteroidia bacterium]